MPSYSPLQLHRMQFKPELPTVLLDIKNITAEHKNNHSLSFKKIENLPHNSLRVGVVFSGGPAPGGHNVIAGLYDALKKLNINSQLFGFIDGPKGIIDGKSIELNENSIAHFRNQGGFDLIGTGRSKIETPEQFKAAETTMRRLQLDGLVIIGGDDSNTNAALLAEYFKKEKCPTRVIGVPKTIDGDLKNRDIEVSFGFDTACKTYSETIGNILRDCLSAKKYYYFIKLMGRSASHIALECALQTHPNLTLIGEEIASKKQSLQKITDEITDLICSRANIGKNYGVILIPEGIIEFIPEFKQLISELNLLLAKDASNKDKPDQLEYIAQHLSPEALHCFDAIPRQFQTQLLIDRDSHGNVQVSKIETDRLFIDLVEKELAKRESEGDYKGAFNLETAVQGNKVMQDFKSESFVLVGDHSQKVKAPTITNDSDLKDSVNLSPSAADSRFSSQPLFCGYEGRSCIPSNFDAQYCYSLGHVAALLIEANVTGYMSCVKDLKLPVADWKIGGIELKSMMTTEVRQGKEKSVVKKALVDLAGNPFKNFQKERSKWLLEDDYCYPGPIQFFGPKEITDTITKTLALESN